MTVLNSSLAEVRGLRRQRKAAEVRRVDLAKDLTDSTRRIELLEETRNILSIVNDSQTSMTLDFIVGVINKTLSEVFKGDVRAIHLEKSLYAGKHVHLNVKLTTSSGVVRDMKVQSGSGLREIVSFLFLVCLIELQKARRVLIMDELLNGVHSKAKKIVGEIIQMFAASGFQFIGVEYGLNDVGKLYNIEKPKDIAYAYSVGEEVEYKDQIFLYTEGLSELDIDLGEEVNTEVSE